MKRNTVLKYSLCAVAALLAAALAIATTDRLRTDHQRTVAAKAVEDLRQKLTSYTIDSQLMGALMAMGLTQPELKQAVAVSGPASGAADQSMEALGPLRLQFGLDGTYLIDSKGVIIAHETAHKPSTGADVSFRPYFRQAMAGRLNIYAAVGSQTAERGLYYACPIYSGMSATTFPIGVVLAKLPGDHLDDILKQYEDSALLVSPQEVVFATSNPGWLYAMNGAADAGRVEAIKKLKQFGAHFDSGKPVSLPFSLGADSAVLDGRKFLLAEAKLDWGDPSGPWRVVALSSVERAIPPGLLAGVGAAAGVLTFIIAVMAMLLIQARGRQRESARRFKFLGTALESCSLAVLMTDARGLISWVNPRFEGLTGYSPDEALGNAPGMLSSGLTPKQSVRELWETVTGGGTFTGDFINRKKDGGLYHARNVVTPVKDENRRLLGFVCLQEDISRQKQAEQAILESESKYRELVESASSIILKLDMDGNIIFFNEFAQAFFGFSQDEVLGGPIESTIGSGRSGLGRDAKSAIEALGGRPGQYEKLESENVCKDGRRVWISWTNKVIHDESTGRPKGLLCIGLDATDRKTAQDSLNDALEVISGSIRYASRIQRAILPPVEQSGRLVPKHFVVWEPRDMVGGDIYWIRPWGDGTLIILADCTGHGVPGAFITLISSGALDRALTEASPGDPAELIALMNRYVKGVLGQELETNQVDGSDDGLELGACYISPDRDSIVYSGAHFQLFTVNGGDVEIFKGHRKGIGYRFVPLDARFGNEVIHAKPGQRFYMTSDGLIDQIGGHSRRSFGKKRFVDLLSSLRDVPMESQGEAIFEAIERHRGGENRRDDISVIGFEI